MNVTQDVMNDLLPVYFSGEASADTRTLVEDYFRENPEFERIARGSAKPLDALRAVTTVAPEAEREKRDLECVRHELRRNKVFFGVALFLTLVPLAVFFSHGHFVWLIREDPWEAVVCWSMATVLWLGYFGRLTRRTASLLLAIIFIVAPIALGWHFSFANGVQVRGKGASDLLWEAILFWSVAAVMLVQYFAKLRRRTVQTVLAILLTVFPLPLVLHAVFVGGSHIWSSVAGPAVLWLFAAWIWVMLSRQKRKTKAGEDSESDCL